MRDAGTAIEEDGGIRPVRVGRRGARRTWIQGMLWLCLAPVAVYGHKGTVALLCLLIVTAPDLRAGVASLARYPANWAVRCLAVFLLWCLVSAAWAPDPVAALGAAGRLALLVLLGLVCVAAMVQARGRRPLTLAVTGSAVLLAGLLAIEFLGAGALATLLDGEDHSNLNFAGPGSAIMALIVFPAALIGAEGRRPWMVPVGAAVVALVLAPLPMFASVLAVISGILVFAATWWWRARGFFAAITLFSLVLFVNPFIFRDFNMLTVFSDKLVEVPTSWQHRLGIWKYVSGQALERPLLGHGFDSSRVLGRDPPSITVIGRERSWVDAALPLHPHSLGLQLWLELGAIGVALGVAVLWGVVLATIRAMPGRTPMSAAAAALTAAMVIASISYGAWQSWWVAALWLTAAAVALGSGGRSPCQP